MKRMTLLLLSALTALPLLAENIKLPEPDKTSGKPLMQCITERRTIRQYKAGATLSPKQISTMLYAAWGFNRPDKRTIATARNRQDLEIYIALNTGIYRYNAKTNVLELKCEGNHKAELGKQTPMFEKSAAVVIYVSDLSRFGENTPQDQKILYAAAHAGSAYQDVYLYCANENLGTVLCRLINQDTIRSLLKLPSNIEVLFAQPVGVPVE